MQVLFKLNHRTNWGQSVTLLIYNESNSYDSFDMTCENENKWKVSLTLPDDVNEINYRYAIRKANNDFRYEHDGIRKVSIKANLKSLVFEDYWRTPNGDSPFDTTAFTACFFKRKKSRKD